jgi:aminopeptidase N
VVGSFAFYNTHGFHAADGSGYRYLVDYLIALDKLNPQVASRLVTPLLQVQRYSQSYQTLMLTQLNRLFNSKGLSRDLFEKLSKTLSKF